MAAIITAAAALVTINWTVGIGRLQILWVIIASMASLIYATYIALANSRTTEKIAVIDATVTSIKAGDKNKAIALVAKILSVYTKDVVASLDKPELFAGLIDRALFLLHYAICKCHEIDDDKLRVFLLTYEPLEPSGQGGDGSVKNIHVHAYPPNTRLPFTFDEQIREQMDAVMSRRYPYGKGWLKGRTDGSPARDEYDVLAPRESEIHSYIRVGIPQIGVISIDSSDDAAPLLVADRDLALTFADVLASAYR